MRGKAAKFCHKLALSQAAGVWEDTHGRQYPQGDREIREFAMLPRGS